MLDIFPKEYLIAAIVAGVPVVGFLFRWMIEVIFSILAKYIAKSFEGLTQRLDTMEELVRAMESLVRDLIKNQGESIAYQKMNSEETARIREKVHSLENAVTVLKTSCEMCVIRAKSESARGQSSTK